MFRFLVLLVGMLTTSRSVSGGRRAAFRADDPGGTAPLPGVGDGDAPDGDRRWPSRARPPRQPNGAGSSSPEPAEQRGAGRRMRRRGPGKVTWAAVGVLAVLIFRKVMAWAVLTALAGLLHVTGLDVRLPHVKLSWPWQTVAAAPATGTDLGPWVLQKIEGISRPALGTENFDFTFTRTVSHDIGWWPCWYSSTFEAVGHASATVDLNPGSSWWAPSAGHYLLRVLSRPAAGRPGRVSVIVVLPQPQLPQSVHDVAVDDTLSHPIDTQHSWTYPGLGCGALIRPQFGESVLYAQAQGIAFAKVLQDPQISGPLVSAAKAEAGRIIRGDFIQPTVNALGYKLADFSIFWSAGS